MNANAVRSPAVSADLLARYDRPGPRYTSYPTALALTADVGPDTYSARLAAASVVDAPLSVYVHLPFCEHRCSFCACHAIEPRSRDSTTTYIDHLCAEIAMVADHLGDRRRVSQCHWGGGTPTYYEPDELRRLQHTFDRHFQRDPGAECSVEADPRVTTEAHVAALAELGFNRISIGVQDLDPGVQAAIGRFQTEWQARALVAAARRHGFASVNLDLVYGLPGQSMESFRTTLTQVVDLAPDRLAVFSFAHLPDDRPNQRRIDAASLPQRGEKLEMFAEAVTLLTRAGYVWIGMDHFALPGDDLVNAQADGRLHRNFMGYTTSRAPDLVGFGASAIGDVSGGLFQNHKRLRPYYAALDAGTVPAERGYLRTADDDVRRHVITALMCNRGVSWAEVVAGFGVDPPAYFESELRSLDDGPCAELVVVSPDGVELNDLGALFPRTVAMAFDRSLGPSPTLGPER